MSLNLVMRENDRWARGVRTVTGGYGAVWTNRIESVMSVDCRLTTAKSVGDEQ